jgi:hypothetical protein
MSRLSFLQLREAFASTPTAALKKLRKDALFRSAKEQRQAAMFARVIKHREREAKASNEVPMPLSPRELSAAANDSAAPRPLRAATEVSQLPQGRAASR